MKYQGPSGTRTQGPEDPGSLPHTPACFDPGPAGEGKQGDWRQALPEQGWGPEGTLGWVLVDRWTDGTAQAGRRGETAQPAGAPGERSARRAGEAQSWGRGQ